MRIRYSEEIEFNLPNEYDESKRLHCVESLLREHSELFEYTENHDTRYDSNINRVLDLLAYYLITANKHNPDGTLLRNNLYIMTEYKKRERRKELHLDNWKVDF